MASASYSDALRTPKARASYPNIHVPQKMEDGSKKYNITLLISKGSDTSALQKAVLDAATKAWGDKAKEQLNNGVIKSPFLDGDGPQGINKKKGERKEGYAGHIFIRLSANEDHPPEVVDKQLQPVMDKTKIYSGCYVYAVVFAYTWENDKNGKGVSFGFSTVQFAGDGEKLAAGSSGPDGKEFLEAIPDEGAPPAATTTGKGAGGMFFA